MQVSRAVRHEESAVIIRAVSGQRTTLTAHIRSGRKATDARREGGLLLIMRARLNTDREEAIR